MGERFPLNKITVVSGGQSGVDRAALDIAIEFGLGHGGWCPKGRIAEDGIIPEQYELKETPLTSVEQRTEWNVRDSDGTLIVAFGDLKEGTLFTKERVICFGRPLFLQQEALEVRLEDFHKWLCENEIKVLNVAGPRESYAPGYVYKRTVQILRYLFMGNLDS